MKNQYWILGDWNKISKEEELEQNILDISRNDNKIQRFSDLSDKFIYNRLVVDSRTVIIEINIKTGEKLILTPLEEVLGEDILEPQWSDLFLDFISRQSKVLGYWPLREIDFPRED